MSLPGQCSKCGVVGDHAVGCPVRAEAIIGKRMEMVSATEWLHRLENFLHPTEAWVRAIQSDVANPRDAEIARLKGDLGQITRRLLTVTEEDDVEGALMLLEVRAKLYNDAKDLIRSEEGWPSNLYPSMAERIRVAAWWAERDVLKAEAETYCAEAGGLRVGLKKAIELIAAIRLKHDLDMPEQVMDELNAHLTSCTVCEAKVLVQKEAMAMLEWSYMPPNHNNYENR